MNVELSVFSIFRKQIWLCCSFLRKRLVERLISSLRSFEDIMATGTDVLFEEEKGELIMWKVSDGTYVKPGKPLLVYRNTNGEMKTVTARIAGEVTVDTTVLRGKVTVFWLL